MKTTAYQPSVATREVTATPLNERDLDGFFRDAAKDVAERVVGIVSNRPSYSIVRQGPIDPFAAPVAVTDSKELGKGFSYTLTADGIRLDDTSFPKPTWYCLDLEESRQVIDAALAKKGLVVDWERSPSLFSLQVRKQGLADEVRSLLKDAFFE